MRRGTTKKLKTAIESIYADNKMYIRKDNSQSTEFPINDGLRQGGVLSPTLFIIVMDDVMKEVKKKVKTTQIGYYNLTPTEISHLAFADDLMICAPTEKDLQNNLVIWEKALKNNNIRINTTKTKEMVFNNKNNSTTNIKLNEEKIEQVNSFKYLGVHIQNDGNMETEINNRINKTIQIYHQMKNKFIGRKEVDNATKMIVYKTIYRPTLTYGAETWVLTKEQRSKIQATEMKFLRRVKGITRMDRIRNETVRDELNITSVQEWIEQQQLKWYGHLIRMRDTKPAKKIWNTKVRREKKRGRPRKGWGDEISTILKKRNIDWAESKNIAKDKKKWASFVYSNERNDT